MKSSDFMISDPQSPLTHTLPKSHTIPPLTPSPNPSIYDFQGPSTPSEEYFSEPASPEATNIQSSTNLDLFILLSASIHSFELLQKGSQNSWLVRVRIQKRSKLPG